jgi:protein-export membrane protein SecD
MNDKQAWWKFTLLAGLIALSMIFVYPPKEKIQLGLDLQGGTSFTVTVDEEAVRKEQLDANPKMTPEELDKKVNAILNKAQDRALEVLRNRVDNLGISEPIIYPGKDNRIIIQLPGADEQMRKEAEKLILSVAVLEFKIVHKKNAALVSRLFDENLAPEGYLITHVGSKTGYKRDPSFSEKDKDDEYRKRLRRFKIPDASHEFLLQKEEEEGQVYYTPVYVKWRAALKGDRLVNARVDYKGMGQPVVLISFDSKGAKRFKQITQDLSPQPGQESRRQLAIVLDGTLYSAPFINEPISGGKAEISGRFSPAEAILLSNILKAGALPAPVKIIEKRSVSPSLGTDSITSGVSATLYGMAGVVLFMLLYYRVSGLVANAALLLNILILPLGMIATAGFLGIFSSDGSSGQSAI